MHFPNSVLRASLRSVTIGTWFHICFDDRLQHDLGCGLHQLVERGSSARPEFSVMTAEKSQAGQGKRSRRRKGMCLEDRPILMAFDHSRRRWFGTCSCQPVPRGLPSSIEQLHTLGPPRPLRSWRTIIRVVHDMSIKLLSPFGVPPTLQQTVHVQVGEQRAGHPSLRCPAVVILPSVNRRFPFSSRSSTGACSHILIRRSTSRSTIRRATHCRSSQCGMVSKYLDRSASTTSV